MALALGYPIRDQILIPSALALTYTYNLFGAVTGSYPGIPSHTWSLAQEEQFYLVAPWFIRKVRLENFRRAALICAGVAAPVMAARLLIAIARPGTIYYAYVNPVLNADAMLLGLALAFVAADVERPPAWLTAVGRSNAAATAAWLLILATAIFGGRYRWQAIPATVGAIASVVVLTHLSVTGDSPIHRLLRSRPLVWLGERSYGLYLYHWPLVVLLNPNSADSPLIWLSKVAAVVALSVLLAAASSRWLEAPVRRYVRQRFASPSLGPAEGAARGD